MADIETAQKRRKEWEQRVYDAQGFDEMRTAIQGWRADELALDPEPESTCLAVSLMSAIKEGDLRLTEYLLKEAVQISRTVGVQAASQSPGDKKIDIFELLYRYGWNVNQGSGKDTPILGHCAGNDAATRWMLDHGANPNPRVHPRLAPINYAAKGSSVDTIKRLLDSGADPRPTTALKFAIMRRDGHWKEVIQLLLDHGCDINAFDPCGFRAMRGCQPGSILHSAAGRNLYHTIPFLLEKGADPLKISENGFTPAELALDQMHEEAASILVDAEKEASQRLESK